MAAGGDGLGVGSTGAGAAGEGELVGGPDGAVSEAHAATARQGRTTKTLVAVRIGATRAHAEGGDHATTAPFERDALGPCGPGLGPRPWPPMGKTAFSLAIGCAIALAACSGSSASISPGAGRADDQGAPSQTGVSEETDLLDRDHDGIADAREAELAAAYLPFVSVHKDDGCNVHGILYRLAPHPKASGRVMMWVDVLYAEDCGANGHIGDNEMFSLVFDPEVPAPAGILAVRAISHQGTPCEHITTCGQCSGMTTCETGWRDGQAYPVVYASKNKHGGYVDKGTCSSSLLCDYGGCGLAPVASTAPMVNAGEPAHALVHDLTTEGFITEANGWADSSLMHFDPWATGNFGRAGSVANDLVDEAFVIDVSKCP